ncbi:MAG TPA: hypothetical protein VFV33_17400, partial [Gemmatimonadaceae bacterium]|nr:hypothetical protein [Gemmatimonadaceae bacterium]
MDPFVLARRRRAARLARRIVALHLASAAASSAPMFAQSANVSPPPAREPARDIIRRVQRIATPEGIDTLYPIQVGDNRQW